MNMDDLKVAELETLVGENWFLDSARTIDVGHGMKIRIEYVDNGNEAPFPLQQAIRLDNAIIPAILAWSKVEEVHLPTAEEVEFTVGCSEEHAEIRGSAMASGDATFDTMIEDGIIERLEEGNQWAWCSVKVTAKFGKYEGCDYLGCCSYKSLADFINTSGYYADMKEQALASLHSAMEDDLGKMV